MFSNTLTPDPDLLHLVAEEKVSESTAPSKMVIVRFTGRIDAKKKDSHLLIRLNGATQGYTSFVLAGGHYSAGEWDSTGFYIGRNGWRDDCAVSFEYKISLATGSKRSGFGQSTFSHGSGNIIGYTSHGYWNDTNSPITKLQVFAVGGGQPVFDLFHVEWI